jgi:7-cyano-7-deazaguanine reductase
MLDANSRKARDKVSGYTEKEAKAGLSEKLPEIDTFPNQFAGYEIRIEVPEFTSV